MDKVEGWALFWQAARFYLPAIVGGAVMFGVMLGAYALMIRREGGAR